jgi:alpha-glucosidase
MRHAVQVTLGEATTRSSSSSTAWRSWWETGVVYQIYVRSFTDGDGDGIGDLRGIRSRLPYLVELGVDAIWLTPCFPSPQHDHGYDVADYFDIEPAYGSLDDFDQLVDEAHRVGIRVLMDIVPNHCSWDHPLFRAALNAPLGSEEREMFWFRRGSDPDGSTPPNNWKAIFGGAAWTQITEPDGAAGMWYLHTFTPQQPDWNWSNPNVVAHFENVLRFWFDRGVDGFRVDAVVPVGKHPDLPDAPTTSAGTRETDVALQNPYSMFRKEGHEVWRGWRRFVDAYNFEHPERDVFTVAEAYTPQRPDLLLDYANRSEFHQVFTFDLLLSTWNAASLRKAIEPNLAALIGADVAPTWTLNNHDAHRVVTRYGRADAHLDSSYTGNNLVNSDAPVDVAVGTRRATAGALLMLSLPGSAYLYQGEELGLPEVVDIPDSARQDPIFFRTEGREAGRDGCRIPLPFTVDAGGNHGFSSAQPASPSWLPQPIGWGQHAADAQVNNPASVYSIYRHALATRRRFVARTSRDIYWHDLPDHLDHLLCFDRGALRVLLNCSTAAVALPAWLTAAHSVAAASNLDVALGAAPMELPGDTCVWLIADDASALPT